MQELISAAILIATLYGGTVAATKIHDAVREVALTKAAQGLPQLSGFGHVLTSQEQIMGRYPHPQKEGRKVK